MTYDVDVTPSERQLVGLGAEYHSHVTLHDFDGGDGVGAALVEFPRGLDTQSHLDVTVGSSVQQLDKREEAIFPRRAAPLNGSRGEKRCAEYAREADHVVAMPRRDMVLS